MSLFIHHPGETPLSSNKTNFSLLKSLHTIDMLACLLETLKHKTNEGMRKIYKFFRGLMLLQHEIYAYLNCW